MTIKERLEAILLNKSLTKQERSTQIADVFDEFVHDTELSFDDMCEWWNNTIADIVVEHNLGAVH